MPDRRDVREAAIFEQRGPIAIVTLNRPEAANSLNSQMHRDVVPMWEEINNNDEIRVGIVTAAGDRAFCAGRDLREFVKAYGSDEKPAVRAVDDPNDPLFGKLCNHYVIKKPFIAALNGFAVGGGLQMSLMADIRVMAENSYVAAMQGKANVTGGNELAFYFPWGVANYLLMANGRVSSEDCLRYGFVQRVVPREKVLDTAIEIANQILESGPDAIRYFKEGSLERQRMSGGLMTPEDIAERRAKAGDRVQTLTENKNLVEGMKAFVEGRKATYE